MAKTKGTRKTVTVRTKTTPKGPRKELLALLDDLGDEEVAWLVTQARTMVYNHKVDEVNQAARDLADSRRKSAGTGDRKAAPAPTAVDIVQSGGPKTFNIVMGQAHLFINLAELKALVKIAQSAEDAGDGAGRLYRWCDRERRDIINDGGLSGPKDPRLAQLHQILRDRYTVD